MISWIQSLKRFAHVSALLALALSPIPLANADETSLDLQRAARWYVEHVCPASASSPRLSPLPSILLEQAGSIFKIARVLLPEAEWRDRHFGDDESRERLGRWIVTTRLQEVQKRAPEKVAFSVPAGFQTTEGSDLSGTLSRWFDGVVFGIDSQTLQRAFREIGSHHPPATWESERSHCLRDQLLAQIDGLALQVPVRKVGDLVRGSEGVCLRQFPNP